MEYTDPVEEQELITLLRNKDPRAYSWLYEKYAGALYTFIAQVIPDSAQKNEVLQEVFESVFRDFDSYDPTRSRLFTFILKMARQAAIIKIQPGTPTIESHEPNGLGKLMTKLNPEEKELLHLSWFKGFTIEQVALQLNISPAVAKKRIRNTLLQLYSL